MPNGRAYKADTSFLEKLAMGAIGTRAVFEDLNRQGHRAIELERGSRSYKVWKKIKIKRLRMPDILCLRCAARVEARAKAEFAISMSHSLSDPDRGWDSGLSDSDIVALSVCTRAGEGVVEWQASCSPRYSSVADLREAFTQKRVIVEKPKGREEGFEVRVTWPTVTASTNGTVGEVTRERLTVRRESDHRTIPVKLIRRGIPLNPLVDKGERVAAGQVLASVVPVSSTFPCQGRADGRTFLQMLSSASVADRYAAAKALCHFQGGDIIGALAERMKDAREHIYVRLESAASLTEWGS